VGWISAAPRRFCSRSNILAHHLQPGPQQDASACHPSSDGRRVNCAIVVQYCSDTLAAVMYEIRSKFALPCRQGWGFPAATATEPGTLARSCMIPLCGKAMHGRAGHDRKCKGRECRGNYGIQSRWYVGALHGLRLGQSASDAESRHIPALHQVGRDCA
jgi:hypothetical protein